MQYVERSCDVFLGCDPELFLRRDGKIVPSREIIPESGSGDKSCGRVVRDGMLVEIHPNTSICRESLAYNIAKCLNELSLLADGRADISFDGTVRLSKKEMDAMSTKDKVLGCSPSLSAYGATEVKVDGQKHRNRSAGGHIHLSTPALRQDPLTHPEIVPLLDLLLGNTLVLIDRNPDNATRRKIYGRAGEHRRPIYPNGDRGLEYRTPSNAWLRHYVLMSFVMSMARFTVNIIHNDIIDWTSCPCYVLWNRPAKAKDLKNQGFHRALLDTVDQRAVISAINHNDYDLAMQNFLSMLNVFLEIVHPDNCRAPFNVNNINAFMYFLEKGVDHWFSKDALSNWKRVYDGEFIGWERFRDKILSELKRTKTKESNHAGPAV